MNSKSEERGGSTPEVKDLTDVAAIRLTVIDDLLLRCLKAGQDAPAGSVARSTLLGVATSLAQDQMQQNRKVLSGETAILAISNLVDETLALASAASGDRILKSSLISAASSLSSFLGFRAVQKEEGYEFR